MNDNVLEKIEAFLKAQKSLNLATVTAAGLPMVHTLAYVSDGAVVFFATDITSRKAVNIATNPAVAYTVDEPYSENWANMKGIQAMGKACLIEDPKENEHAMKLIVQKFPQMAKMPPNPNFRFYRVEPTEIYFLDSSVAFGHRFRVEF